MKHEDKIKALIAKARKYSHHLGGFDYATRALSAMLQNDKRAISAETRHDVICAHYEISIPTLIAFYEEEIKGDWGDNLKYVPLQYAERIGRLQNMLAKWREAGKPDKILYHEDYPESTLPLFNSQKKAAVKPPAGSLPLFDL